MTTPTNLHPSIFIQKAISSQTYKIEVTLEEIEKMVKKRHLLTRMNERGLFMTLIAEMIFHQYRLFLVKIRTLQAEVCPLPKALRKKRENRDENPPKRRKRRVRVNVDGVDIQ